MSKAMNVVYAIAVVVLVLFASQSVPGTVADTVCDEDPTLCSTQ